MTAPLVHTGGSVRYVDLPNGTGKASVQNGEEASLAGRHRDEAHEDAVVTRDELARTLGPARLFGCGAVMHHRAV